MRSAPTMELTPGDSDLCLCGTDSCAAQTRPVGPCFVRQMRVRSCRYVHRVGRTGRLAADGHALSFLTRNMAPLAAPLLELLQACTSTAGPRQSFPATGTVTPSLHSPRRPPALYLEFCLPRSHCITIWTAAHVRRRCCISLLQQHSKTESIVIHWKQFSESRGQLNGDIRPKYWSPASCRSAG